jgi:putative ATP-dependent endonuclease of OLD family
VCPVDGGERTSNASLKFFYGAEKNLDDFIALPLNERVLRKCPENGTWESNEHGHLLCIYQTKEIDDADKEYHARSFEDAFLHINMEFIKSETLDNDGNFIKDNPFVNLTNKHLRAFIDSEAVFELATRGVGSKPSFAMEILLCSTTEEINFTPKGAEPVLTTFEFSNWNTPSYIKEGLQWLKQD